jgi:hypothetical protein
VNLRHRDKDQARQRSYRDSGLSEKEAYLS